MKALSDGRPVSLHVRGELSEVADSVNKASLLLSRQNKARANWISGVSHDIRTPLSMIMGYAEKIAGDRSANSFIQEQAEIVRRQSVRIKELIQAGRAFHGKTAGASGKAALYGKHRRKLRLKAWPGIAPGPPDCRGTRGNYAGGKQASKRMPDKAYVSRLLYNIRGIRGFAVTVYIDLRPVVPYPSRFKGHCGKVALQGDRPFDLPAGLRR